MTSRKKNSNKRNTLLVTIVMLVALAAQIFYWSKTYKIGPQLGIVSPVPSDIEAEALAFGDRQFYFRMQALNLQFMGDTWGRSTPLKDYDMKMVYRWMKFLDKYDPKSNMLPSAAAYYYSKTQNPHDVVYMLDYLEERSFADPEYNWWWLSQSIYLANAVLGDKERAVKIAAVLRTVKADVPIWARQMEAFLREDMGEKDKAADIMCDAIKNSKNFQDLPQREIDFFVYFFNERLQMWKGKEDELIQYCAEREMRANGELEAKKLLDKQLPEHKDTQINFAGKEMKPAQTEGKAVPAPDVTKQEIKPAAPLPLTDGLQKN